MRFSLSSVLARAADVIERAGNNDANGNNDGEKDRNNNDGSGSDSTSATAAATTSAQGLLGVSRPNLLR